MIEIDGALGGGSVLRIALQMSIVTQKPFHIINIRKNRPKPGVKAQHLLGITALKKLSNSKVEGAFLGSEELTFYPGEYRGGHLNLDVGTAGSITLVLQSILLPMMLLKPTSLKIVGGTDVPYSPTSDYFKNVLLFYFRKYSEVSFKILKRGYYPKGGGVVSIKTRPYNLGHYRPLILNKAEEEFHILGISTASKNLMNAEVSERQAKSAREFIKHQLGKEAVIDVVYSEASSPGSSICLWAVFENLSGEASYTLGADQLGKRGVSSEKIGKLCAEKLVYEVKHGVVDKLLADQLIPLLSIVGGSIKTSEITDHIKSAVYVVNKFIDEKVELDEENKIIKRI